MWVEGVLSALSAAGRSSMRNGVAYLRSGNETNDTIPTIKTEVISE